MTKNKLEELIRQYAECSEGNEELLKEIAVSEIAEMTYNSNAIENSTLTLEDTEKILAGGQLSGKVNIREVFEANNLAGITQVLLEKTKHELTVKLI
ncbi:MAG: hypothetical protein KBF73_10120, partial [Flavobacteriales bacterium]|nr:hypothetical protein [Flavobacteriales bacterium]